MNYCVKEQDFELSRRVGDLGEQKRKGRGEHGRKVRLVPMFLLRCLDL